MSLEPSEPRASSSDRSRGKRKAVTATTTALFAVCWLCAVTGAWQAAVVVSAGTVALTVTGSGGGRETPWEIERWARSLERVAREIARRSPTDGLTKLPNRDAFDRRLA